MREVRCVMTDFSESYLYILLVFSFISYIFTSIEPMKIKYNYTDKTALSYV